MSSNTKAPSSLAGSQLGMDDAPGRELGASSLPVQPSRRAAARGQVRLPPVGRSGRSTAPVPSAGVWVPTPALASRHRHRCRRGAQHCRKGPMKRSRGTAAAFTGRAECQAWVRGGGERMGLIPGCPKGKGKKREQGALSVEWVGHRWVWERWLHSRGNAGGSIVGMGRAQALRAHKGGSRRGAHRACTPSSPAAPGTSAAATRDAAELERGRGWSRVGASPLPHSGMDAGGADPIQILLCPGAGRGHGPNPIVWPELTVLISPQPQSDTQRRQRA